MLNIEREDVRSVWRQLSKHNNWMLVNNEDGFLDNVMLEIKRLSHVGSMRQNIRVATLRAYSSLLYKGLQQRQERAAYELSLAFIRSARKNGWSIAEAEDLAQESLLRLLERLQTLNSPHSLLSWSFRIFHSTQTQFRKRSIGHESLEVDGDELYHAISSTDFAKEIEQQLIATNLHAQLSEKIPNDLERVILLRSIIFGEHPRDIARELELPLHRTRVAKFRALQRLRNDEEFMQLLHDLTNTSYEQQPEETDQMSTELIAAS